MFWMILALVLVVVVIFTIWSVKNDLEDVHRNY